MPDSVRGRLAGVTRGQWVFAVLCLLLMVALPVGVTLAREDRFESRVELVVVAGLPEAQRLAIPADLNAYVSRVAERRRVTEATSRRLSFPLDSAAVAERTQVVPGGDSRRVVLVATGTTPERATELAEVHARRVAIEPRRGSEELLRARLRRLLARGEKPGLSAAERVSIAAEIDEAAAVIRTLGARPALQEGRASTPGVTAPMDKLVNGLPGQLPPRPSPVLAGLIGLLLAGSLLAAWLLIRDAFADRLGRRA